MLILFHKKYNLEKHHQAKIQLQILFLFPTNSLMVKLKIGSSSTAEFSPKHIKPAVGEHSQKQRLKGELENQYFPNTNTVSPHMQVLK